MSSRIKILPLAFGIALTIVGLVLSGRHMMADQATKPDITVITPWARATPGGVTIGAAYLEVRSTTKAGDLLVAVSSPRAGRVELHSHITEAGVMKMRKVDGLAVNEDRALLLAPGGHHIMLFDLSAPLKAGDELPLTLTFEKAGAVAVVAQVAAIGAQGPDGKNARGSASHDDTKHGFDLDQDDAHRGSAVGAE